MNLHDFLRRDGTISKTLINGELPTGAMVALAPDNPERFAVVGGEERDALHVTSKFLGKASDWNSATRSVVRSAIRNIANSTQPIQATVTGVARYGENNDAVVLELGGSDLHELHKSVHAVTPGIALKWPNYKPHMTILYTTANVRGLDRFIGENIYFSKVQVAFGDDVENYHFTLPISKGDYPGHPFRGNQWTGGRGFVMAPDRGAGSGGPPPATRRRRKQVRTAFGLVDVVPDSEYKMSTLSTARDLEASLRNPRSSVSLAINPLTGHRMTNTEMGDTFENLIVQQMADTPEFRRVFGRSKLHHIVGAAQYNRDRRGPIDLVNARFGFEVKSLSMSAGDPKASLTKEEVQAKANAVRAMKKSGAILVPVFDHQTATIHLYAYVGRFAPNQKNRLQIRFSKRSMSLQQVSTGNSVYIMSMQVTKRQWQEAQYQANWLRDKDNEFIDPRTQTMSGARRRVSKSVETIVSATKRLFHSMSKSDDLGDEEIHEGDLVIGLAEDGVPYVMWAGEPGLSQQELDDLVWDDE